MQGKKLRGERIANLEKEKMSECPAGFYGAWPNGVPF
jgi:hypothetical protein